MWGRMVVEAADMHYPTLSWSLGRRHPDRNLRPTWHHGDTMTDTSLPANTVPLDEDTSDSTVESPEIVEPVVVHTPESLGLELPEDRVLSDELLLSELGETRAKAAELFSSFQRVSAELDNYRKRTERDRAETVIRASQRVIESLLPALDSLDAAIGIEPTTDGETRMLDGMKSTHAQILEALRSDGFEEILAVGATFDPALHEAVSVISGDGEQVVHEVVRKGYSISGRVIRPALVVVGHRPSEDSE